MKLPNGARAYVDIVKLRDYSLNTTHIEGKHKARVFRQALGIVSDDASWLMAELLRAAANFDCVEGKASTYGKRYLIDFRVSRLGKTAMIRSAWMVRSGEENPRLVTCYVL